MREEPGGRMLTVLSGRSDTVRARSKAASLVLHLLHNLVEEEVEELVRVLVHRSTEELIKFLDLVNENAGRNSPLIDRVPADVEVQGAEGGEQGGRRGRYRECGW